jgi:hypothetical protein
MLVLNVQRLSRTKKLNTFIGQMSKKFSASQVIRYKSDIHLEANITDEKRAAVSVHPTDAFNGIHLIKRQE